MEVQLYVPEVDNRGYKAANQSKGQLRTEPTGTDNARESAGRSIGLWSVL